MKISQHIGEDPKDPRGYWRIFARHDGVEAVRWAQGDESLAKEIAKVAEQAVTEAASKIKAACVAVKQD